MGTIRMRGVTPVVGELIEALRGEFCAPSQPLGGPVTEIEHRPGADIALDGLFTDGCSGLVWVNVLRLYRTTRFPDEDPGLSPCVGQRAMVVQIGAARCVGVLDDYGNPPSPDRMGHDALVGLDDAARLERAACRAINNLDERGVIVQAAWSATEPTGPEGGALAWTLSITMQLA